MSPGPHECSPEQSSAQGLRQLPGHSSPPHPHPRQLVPLVFVLHLFLHLVDSLQRLQTFIEQKRRVIYQHVYVADKLLPRTERQLWWTRSYSALRPKAAADPKENGPRRTYRSHGPGSLPTALAPLQYGGGQGLLSLSLDLLPLLANCETLTAAVHWGGPGLVKRASC